MFKPRNILRALPGDIGSRKRNTPRVFLSISRHCIFLARSAKKNSAFAFPLVGNRQDQCLQPCWQEKTVSLKPAKGAVAGRSGRNPMVA